MPPKVGTVLADVEGEGAGAPHYSAAVNTHGGFSIFPEQDNSSGITTYDAGGNRVGAIPAAEFTGGCDVTDVTVDGKRIVVTEKHHEQPAQGITPAQYSLTMTGWSADSDNELWTATLVAAQKDDIKCGSVAVTPDGRWGIWGDGAPPDKAAIIDLDGGKARTVTGSDAAGLIGNYVARPVEGPTGDPKSYTLTDPATGSSYGSLNKGTFIPNGVAFKSSVLLAPVMNFYDEDSIQADQVGVSPNGTNLYASIEGAGDNGYQHSVVAYSLPSTTVRWKLDPPPNEDYKPMADAAGTLIVGDEFGNKLIAVDDNTGKLEWSIPYGQVCGLTSRQLLLAVNEQFATIDLTTGKQLSYNDDATYSCGDIRPGGIAVTSPDSGATTVTQALAP